jgi:hypothetical protein
MIIDSRIFKKIFREKPERLIIQDCLDILNELRNLKSRYFESKSEEEKSEIEEKQRELVEKMKEKLDEILKHVEQTRKEKDKNELMGQWGYFIDQLAINLPLPDLLDGKNLDLQQEALSILIPYLNEHPEAKEIARAIFMIYHHGAGIDKNLFIEEYQRALTERQEHSKEFAIKYIESENKAKPFLEKYIALILDLREFSLDRDYDILLRVRARKGDEIFNCLLDVANWYARIAHYQRIAGFDKDAESNQRRSDALYQRLMNIDPNLRKALEAFYKEES